MIYIGALGVLFLLVIFAFNNRFVGREFYAPRVGLLVAHWVGVAIQIAWVGIVTFLLLGWLRGNQEAADLWAVGVLWAVLSVAWEMFAFHWVQRRGWHDVLDDYNPLVGHGWWLVPLAYLLAPIVIHDWLFGF